MTSPVLKSCPFDAISTCPSCNVGDIEVPVTCKIGSHRFATNIAAAATTTSVPTVLKSVAANLLLYFTLLSS